MQEFWQSVQVLSAPVILSTAIVVMMLQIAFWRNSVASWLISCAALIISIVCSFCSFEAGSPAVQITPLLVADSMSNYFTVVVLFAALITTLLAKDYLHKRSGENEEFYLLLLLSTLGALFLLSATHLASFLLGLELLGVALYALIAYPERGHLPLEAATKYLILSGAASAILLFGFALLYAALGALSFAEIGQQLQTSLVQSNQLVVTAAAAFIFTGIAFKLSLVPFHMWTPDVYQGAPSPVTGFLATVSKGAIFVALIRLYNDANLYEQASLVAMLGFLAIASMLLGNLLALQQQNLKRLLAYSSIAHLGYLLVALIVFSQAGLSKVAVEAANFYLAAYVVTSLAAFALLTIICNEQRESEVGDIDSISGLFYRQPLLALLFTVAMLSLAGIPLTAGFVGKFYLFSIGIDAGLWPLVVAMVIGSAIGIYYYLRVIFAMAQDTDAASDQSSQRTTLGLVSHSVIALLIALTLYLGVWPQEFMNYLDKISL